jgi:hypothetical protein
VPFHFFLSFECAFAIDSRQPKGVLKMRLSDPGAAGHFRYKSGEKIVWRKSGQRGTVIDGVLKGDPNGAHEIFWIIRMHDGSDKKAKSSEIQKAPQAESDEGSEEQ